MYLLLLLTSLLVFAFDFPVAYCLWPVAYLVLILAFLIPRRPIATGTSSCSDSAMIWFQRIMAEVGSKPRMASWARSTAGFTVASGRARQRYFRQSRR